MNEDTICMSYRYAMWLSFVLNDYSADCVSITSNEALYS